jgi:hypothetical protein
MAYTGFLELLQMQSSFPEEEIGAYFRFDNPGNPTVFAPNMGSGVQASISNTGFWRNSGSGFFSGGAGVALQKTNSIPFCGESSGEFSFLVSSQKSGLQDGVIFSSLGSGTGSVPQITHSGFSFGFNKANKFFFQAYDNFTQKPVKFFINSAFPSKNAFGVGVSRDSLNVKFYDFAESSIDGFSLSFENPIHLSNTFKLGSSLDNAPHWSIREGWRGFLDDFSFASNFYYQQEAMVPFASGLVVNFYYTGETGQTLSRSVVTGYEYALVPLYSGITGYSTVITGEAEDEFGNLYSGVQSTPLYGVTSGSGIVELTGVETFQEILDPDPVFSLDFNELKSYGFDYANSTSEYDADDFVFVRFLDDFSIYQSINLNKQAFFDRVSNSFSYIQDFASPISGFATYLNGVFRTSGAAQFNEFEGFFLPSGEYFYNNNKIQMPNIELNSLDYCAVEEFPYAVHSHFYENFSHQSGVDFIFYTGSNQGEFSAFFNGQKLTSGVHYWSNSSGSYLKGSAQLFSGDLGVLSVFRGISGLSWKQAQNSPLVALETPALSRRHVSYTLNGIKQGDSDFILCSNSDFLTGINSKKRGFSVFINNKVNFFK